MTNQKTLLVVDVSVTFWLVSHHRCPNSNLLFCVSDSLSTTFYLLTVAAKPISNLKQKSIGSALSFIFVGKPDKHHLLQKSNDCKKCKFRPGCDSLFGDSMSDSAEHDMRGWHRHAWQGSLMDDGQRVIARQGERERGDHIINYSSASASAGWLLEERGRRAKRRQKMINGG